MVRALTRQTTRYSDAMARWLAVWVVLASWGFAEVPQLTRAQAVDILFLAETPPVGCDSGTSREQISCLIAARYVKDAAASKVAVSLYEKTGTVMGQLAEQDFDGGYRGKLHLVPRLGMGSNRKHLEFAANALLDFEWFFTSLGGTPNYRWQALDFRFFESVKRRTPSAFAEDWAVAYNVAGSLFGTEAGVRATLFHEVFHLNDQEHRNWSERALGAIFDSIVAKCGVKTACLEPYVADSIKVIGGTYYAFQPGNGVGEYGADLARRYYNEHRAFLKKERFGKAFKCGPPENAKAWKLMADEFFGGVDLIPACK